MTQEEMINEIDRVFQQKEAMREDLNELTEKYSKLLKQAIEDMKMAAESEYLCDVCAHFVKCQTCKYHESLCDGMNYEFGTCPTLAPTPCNGCDYSKGTNFLWRGYVNNTK